MKRCTPPGGTLDGLCCMPLSVASDYLVLRLRRLRPAQTVPAALKMCLLFQFTHNAARKSGMYTSLLLKSFRAAFEDLSAMHVGFAPPM